MERFFVHVANGQVGVSVHNDAVLVHLLNLCKIDDIGAMDAHKIVGQSFFHLLHRQQGDNGLGFALQVYLQLLAHGLDVTDVGNGNLDDAVVGFEENCIGGGHFVEGGGGNVRD